MHSGLDATMPWDMVLGALKQFIAPALLRLIDHSLAERRDNTMFAGLFDKEGCLMRMHM